MIEYGIEHFSFSGYLPELKIYGIFSGVLAMFCGHVQTILLSDASLAEAIRGDLDKKLNLPGGVSR